jgi:ferredoxin
MPGLKIDNKSVEVPEGITILEAARKFGINIPCMCFLEGYEHFTSCMICVVKEKVSDRLLPSCSAPVAGGMIVETASSEVKTARRNTLELLLKEHAGDCEGPCRLACPAHMNIPAVLRLVESGNVADAAAEIKKDILFPGVLGRICPAPCEKACRRGRYDSPVAIKLLERFTADCDINSETRSIPSVEDSTGKTAAIIGAGPAGLTAAFYLSQMGHACTVFDRRDEPGGMLRYGVAEEKLPRSVLDAEIEIIRSLGVLFRMSTGIGKDVSMDELNRSFDAVVIASGEKNPHSQASFGVKRSDRGISINKNSFETEKKGIFACGSAVKPVRMTVKTIFEGKSLSYSVDRFLGGKNPALPPKKFNSILGKLKDGEIEEFMKAACASPRTVPSQGHNAGFANDEALKESNRCLRCDCGKSETCLLRKYAEHYKADKLRYRGRARKNFTKETRHTDVIYESGKCIKCGRCVRIAEKTGERLGLSFIGRGFDISVGVPFDQPLSEGLEKAAAKCTEHCPTGALSFKKSPIRDNSQFP